LQSLLRIAEQEVLTFLDNKNDLLKHTDTLFKIAHADHFSTAIQALTLVSYIVINNEKNSFNNDDKSNKKTLNKPSNTAKSDKSEDMKGDTLMNRYYRALYAILFSDEIQTRSRNTAFFKLLFRSMRSDTSDLRYKYYTYKIYYNTKIYSTYCLHNILFNIKFRLHRIVN
jgi:hypothetical protein